MKEICKGCKKFGIRKGCYRGCDSMPKNNLKEKPMKSKTLQKKIEELKMIYIAPHMESTGTLGVQGNSSEINYAGALEVPNNKILMEKLNELIEAVNNLNSNENK